MTSRGWAGLFGGQTRNDDRKPCGSWKWQSERDHRGHVKGGILLTSVAHPCRRSLSHRARPSPHPVRVLYGAVLLIQRPACYKGNAKADGTGTAGSEILMSMAGPWHSRLSRRERQIMDILFRHGRAPASVVRDELPGDPSSSTVRTQLRILERKRHVRHEEEGLRYVYRPVTPRRAARRSALRHLVETFFDGSAEQAVAALLGGEARRLTEPELERIARAVSDARAAQQRAGRAAGASRGNGPNGNDTSGKREEP